MTAGRSHHVSSPPRSRAAAPAAALALAGGSLVYLTRDTDPAVVGWLDHAGLGALAALVQAARHAVHANVHLPAWFRGSASDAAFGFALGALLADAPPAVVGLGLVVALGHELGQGGGLFPGTFDVGDLAVLTLSFVFALITFRPRASAPFSTPMRNSS